MFHELLEPGESDEPSVAAGDERSAAVTPEETAPDKSNRDQEAERDEVDRIERSG
jgi:hypothetical protein